MLNIFDKHFSIPTTNYKILLIHTNGVPGLSMFFHGLDLGKDLEQTSRSLNVCAHDDHSPCLRKLCQVSIEYLTQYFLLCGFAGHSPSVPTWLLSSSTVHNKCVVISALVSIKQENRYSELGY